MKKEKAPGILESQVVVKKPKHRLRRLLKKAPRFLKWLSGAALICMMGIGLWWGVAKNSYFSIQKIDVVGDLKQITIDTVLKISKVNMGENLFGISLKQVEENILKSQWVQSVSVRRQAPSTLWIYVKEQRPVALLLTDKLYFVSDEGIAFKEVGRESPRDLPVFTGFGKQDSLHDALQLLKFLETSDDFEMFGLSEIHYNGATGFSLVTLLGPMEIRFGKEGFETKLNRLKNIWTRAGDKLGRVKGIDLDYSDKAFVKL